ncbi:hypothetical protein NIIDNTM18_04600 [Mycolicibacterium litorale]|uniref:Uncharacterized protein n=1 Tax=Mycolicibacterium litorale TaxID=758802 RepID=A0A6S6NZC3_9MYCO|nr:hypothetical protein [Mycolicibacterium litorale]BCI51182.1 hypothetical protein NIIDNTM18_04600 [Mycolicibacterium litorale]
MKLIDGYVRSPLAGLAPWILMAVVNGPGRFEEAVSAALGLSLLTLWVGKRHGVAVHALEAFGVAFFAVLAALGLIAPPDTIRWLEMWAGELSNIALASFAVVTVLIRRPFTLAYAKDATPREHWDSPVFLRINHVISVVWAGAFLLSAAAGAYDDAVLHDNGNFWFGWIIPLAAIIFAGAFTDYYPDRATGESTASWARIFDWLPVFVVVTGVVGWVSDEIPDVLGITLIVVGSVGSAVMRKAFPDQPAKVTDSA